MKYDMNLPSHGISNAQLRSLILKNSKDTVDTRAEDVRARLDPGEIIGQLTDLFDEADTADAERLEQLKFKAGILQTVLKKCLPDLRSLEIQERQPAFSKLIIDITGSSSHEGKD